MPVVKNQLLGVHRDKISLFECQIFFTLQVEYLDIFGSFETKVVLSFSTDTQGGVQASERLL